MSETPGAVGTWIFNMVTPIGELMPEVALNLDGTGSIWVVEIGTIEISDAAYNGNSVTFSAEVTTPMGEVELTVSGSVAGNDFSGSIQTPMGPLPVTGVRQP